MIAAAGEETDVTVISNSVDIRCSPEEAFDYLSDHRSELEWNPGIESIDKLTDGPVGLGTKYRAKWKSAPKAVEVETIAYDRPHAWTMHNGGPIEVTVTIRLQPMPAGTRLSAIADRGASLPDNAGPRMPCEAICKLTYNTITMPTPTRAAPGTTLAGSRNSPDGASAVSIPE